MFNPIRGAADIIPQNDNDSIDFSTPMNIKLGFDPTSSHLHLGHLVLLKKARDLQLLGHNIMIVFGTFTARIGDPTGKNQTRPQLDESTVHKNANEFIGQVLKILDPQKTKYFLILIGGMRLL